MRISKQEREYYNSWDTYESDLRDDGWRVPRQLVNNIKHFLRGGEMILDVGCGTGLVGVELQKIGWAGCLVGIDISERRINEAVKKNIYRACFHMDADHLGFPNEKFDVILASALVGITGPRSVLEMRRVLKTSGLIGCAVGELKHVSGGSKRFKSSISCFDKLSDMRKVNFKDLGTGYSGKRNDEHYILYILRHTAKTKQNA